MAANVETMFYVRETPWHGLGVNVEETLTSDEALKQAGLDWEVQPLPIFVNQKEVKGYVANTRSSDQSVLGIVTDQYRLVQNNEAFQFTDALIDSGNVQYETAGSLDNGKKVWMLAKMPEQLILDDQIDPYLVFTNSHDGKASIRIAITPIRVVCQNTLNIALEQSTRQWSTRHMGDMKSKIYEAKRTLVLASNYMNELQVEADKLASQTVSEGWMEEFIVDLFPIPLNTGDRKSDNIIELRDELRQRYFNAPDLAAFRNTKWGVINAVTDLANHTQPRRLTATYKEKLFDKTVNGHPLVDRAYELLKVA